MCMPSTVRELVPWWGSGTCCHEKIGKAGVRATMRQWIRGYHQERHDRRDHHSDQQWPVYGIK